MLARTVLTMALSVRLSVTSRSSIETAKRIKLVFGAEATVDSSYNALKKYIQNKGTFFFTFVPKKSALSKRHDTSTIGGRLKCEKWKIRDMKMQHKIAGVENAGKVNAGKDCSGGKCGKGKWGKKTCTTLVAVVRFVGSQ